MVVVANEKQEGGGRREKGEGGGRREEGGGHATNIKSNNPHRQVGKKGQSPNKGFETTMSRA